MTTTVATVNVRNTATPFTITPTQARAALLKVLTSPPGAGVLVDLVGLQEWAGSARNAMLRELGRLTRFPAARRWLPLVKPVGPRAAGYTWVRPVGGGPTVGAHASRYVPRFVRSKTLAPMTRLERVPGFRSLLGASRVTVAGFTDITTGELVVIIDGHLTRHVEKGGHYRKGLPRTVARHKREVRQLERVIRWHEERDRTVYVAIDGNYDGLELPPLISCWAGHPKRETGGTLGSRRPDVIYGPEEADDVVVIPTISDHDAVVATYR